MSLEALKKMLREKQLRGVKDIRVTTVLKEIEQIEADARERANGSTKRGRRKKLDLVGTAEAAALLGVERPRIGRWKKSGVLPEPVAELAAGPVWFRDQIEGIRAERERRRRVPAT